MQSGRLQDCKPGDPRFAETPEDEAYWQRVGGWAGRFGGQVGGQECTAIGLYGVAPC